MKTRRIISRFILVLIILIPLFLHACKREQWCAECNWACSFDPLTGPTHETFCAYSYDQCEDEVLDFLDGRLLPDCWDCTEPH